MSEEKNKVMPSTLYLVATPIGNLDDITFRAVKVLKECDFIAAEDTRVTSKLLAAYGISKPMITYEEHSKRAAGETILRRLKEGESCALVTDAGTPAISDPGEDVARLCEENGIKVEAIPGACAAITALTLSGLPTSSFVFVGFLSGKDSQKKARLDELSSESSTLIFYEAPHRIAETLKLLADTLGGERKVALCRELTKLNEEIIRATLAEAAETVSHENARGEYVVVVEGRRSDTGYEFWSSLTVREHVLYYVEKMGLDKMSAIKAAAKDRHVPKGVIYKEFVE